VYNVDDDHDYVTESDQIGSGRVHAASSITEAYVRECVLATCIHLWLLHTLVEEIVINVAVAGAHSVVRRAHNALVVAASGFAASVYVCFSKSKDKQERKKLVDRAIKIHELHRCLLMLRSMCVTYIGC